MMTLTVKYEGGVETAKIARRDRQLLERARELMTNLERVEVLKVHAGQCKERLVACLQRISEDGSIS